VIWYLNMRRLTAAIEAQIAEDAQKQELETGIKITVKVMATSPEVVGTLDGHKAYEWIDVELNNGQIRRLTFDSFGQPTKKQPIPGRQAVWLTFHPGICYVGEVDSVRVDDNNKEPLT
jgi:hypothetical protein